MERKLKICVYAIAKNEEKFVDKWMDSMSEADCVIVADTGSVDKTVQKLTERGATVSSIKVDPWRFDTARNMSLALVPEDADICVCTDLDEVFDAGWRDTLEAAWQDGTHIAQYLYNWRLKPNGEPDVQFWYFKIHTRHNVEWRCPVHEYLVHTGGNTKKIFVEGVVLSHYPDTLKSRGNYLGLLEKAVEEDPSSDRMSYYLGREYTFVGDWDKSIKELKRYIDLPSAWWREERASACRLIATAYFRMANYQQCYKWHYRSIFECPYMREPYVEFAINAHKLKDWETVLAMSAQAAKITAKSSSYVNLGFAWDHTVDDLRALSSFYLGMPEQALKYAEAALKVSPEDSRLADNVTKIRAALSTGQSST